MNNEEKQLENEVEDISIQNDTEGAAGEIGAAPEGTFFYRLKLPYTNESLVGTFLDKSLSVGDTVIVHTRFGIDLATLIADIPDVSEIDESEYYRIERKANAEEVKKAAENREKEKEAYTVCKEKIDKHRLDMKLVDVHYLMDESKILFFFTAEKRVDFRELVKDLVSIFKLRIELRQIGVRDEARIVGGLAVCGRAYCCHTVSDNLRPVSIKMAKDQNLSLNSQKISGPCGRLLCCLSYEYSFYQDIRRAMPTEGYKLKWDGTVWKVNELNPVSGQIGLSGEDGRLIFLPVARFTLSNGRWTIRDEDSTETSIKDKRQLSGRECVNRIVSSAPDIQGLPKL